VQSVARFRQSTNASTQHGQAGAKLLSAQANVCVQGCVTWFCRDQDDLVTVEAIKALFGQLPPYNPSLMTGATAQTPQEELVSNRMRIRAWAMVASQVDTAAGLMLHA